MSDIRKLLEDGNSLLRSAYAIASREGVNTNWPAFKARLEECLIEQSILLNATAHVPAATCTPKTFRSVPLENEMNELTWEQKFAAMQSLDPNISIKMRGPASWYISSVIHIQRKSIMEGISIPGLGSETPICAIEDTFKNITTGLEPEAYLEMSNRRKVRWNGFMWAEYSK